MKYTIRMNVDAASGLVTRKLVAVRCTMCDCDSEFDEAPAGGTTSDDRVAALHAAHAAELDDGWAPARFPMLDLLRKCNVPNPIAHAVIEEQGVAWELCPPCARVFNDWLKAAGIVSR